MGRPGGGGGARIGGSRSSFSRSSGSFRPSSSRSSFGSSSSRSSFSSGSSFSSSRPKTTSSYSRPTTPSRHVDRPTSHVSRPSSTYKSNTTHRPSDTYRPTSHVSKPRPKHTHQSSNSSLSSFGMGMGMGYAMGRSANRTSSYDYTPRKTSSYSAGSSRSNSSNNYEYNSIKRSTKRSFKSVVILAIITLVIILLYNATKDNKPGDAPAGRQRVESGLDYDTNVVLTDETSWIEDKDRLGRELYHFWDKTGVQPYIMMLTHNPKLKTDADKEQHTVDLYNELIDREDAILFVYYGEIDLENEVGLMCHALGKQTTEVFDNAALNRWYDNIEFFWYTDKSMTDVYVTAYNDTADTIMRQPLNIWGGFVKFVKAVLKIAAIVLGIITIIVAIVVTVALVKEKKRKKEEETQRILNTSLEELSGQSSGKDELLEKYKS